MSPNSVVDMGRKDGRGRVQPENAAQDQTIDQTCFQPSLGSRQLEEDAFPAAFNIVRYYWMELSLITAVSALPTAPDSMLIDLSSPTRFEAVDSGSPILVYLQSKL